MSKKDAELERWFAEEVEPHGAQLKSYLQGNFPAVGDVDDVVQESYLRIWKARALQPIDSARGFLFTIARRVALNVVRKKRNAPFVDGEAKESSPAVEDTPDACDRLILQERIDLLADALMTLPSRCREVVVLHKVKGLSQREVAFRLGISERTVEVHVRNGVARCLAYLHSVGFKNYQGDGS